MTRTTHTTSRRLLAVALAVTVLSTTVVAGVATAQDDVTLSVSDVQVQPGETATTELSLSGTPNGITGFDVTVRLGSDSARITNATVNPDFALTRSNVADDGSAVQVRAVDLGKDVQAGYGQITLATVTVRGESQGVSPIRIGSVNIDDDDNASVNPTIQERSVGVGDATPIPGGPEPVSTDGSGPGFTAIAALIAAGLGLAGAAARTDD